jgi:hypothetical protein
MRRVGTRGTHRLRGSGTPEPNGPNGADGPNEANRANGANRQNAVNGANRQNGVNGAVGLARFPRDQAEAG